MDNSPFKAKIFIIIVIVLILVLIGVVILTNRIKTQGLKPDVSPTPTPFDNNIKLLTQYPVTPQLFPTYTGAGEDPLTKEELELSQQKFNLLAKLPLKQAEFTVTFDYKNDLFTVTLNEPKTKNAIIFEDWRKKNYPALKQNKFYVK